MTSIFTDKILIDGWAFYLIIVGCLWAGCFWGWLSGREHEKKKRRK